MTATQISTWFLVAGLAWAVPGCNPFSNADKDEDGDGHQAIKFGGGDCDDQDPTVHPGAVDICNGIDDDCDGLTDGGQDSDRDHHAVCDCDDDDPAVHPGAEEACNGVDDDCDSQTDEGLGDRTCPLQAGVCQGTAQTCLGDQGWSDCGYGADFESGDEARCDGLDNDCDGQIDEGLTAVPCQVENQWGSCPGTWTCNGAQGFTECDATTPAQEACDGLDNDCDGQTDEGMELLAPEEGAQADDGIDNNCNGLIDEKGGVMVEIPTLPGTWIDSYEATIFDSPDCTGTRYGRDADDYPPGWPADGDASVTLYACSLPGLIPSGHLSMVRADRACRAQGKRLCTEQEFRWACSMGSDDFYPYANIFVPGVCNDPIGGQGEPLATGAKGQCTRASIPLTFDMSGNLAELIDRELGSDPGHWLALGASYACLLCELGTNCTDCDLDAAADREALEAISSCLVWDVTGKDYRSQRAYPAGVAYPWVGTRCCYPP